MLLNLPLQPDGHAYEQCHADVEAEMEDFHLRVVDKGEEKEERRIEDRVQVDRGEVELKLYGLDPGHIEQFIGRCSQAPRSPARAASSISRCRGVNDSVA